MLVEATIQHRLQIVQDHSVNERNCPTLILHISIIIGRNHSGPYHISPYFHLGYDMGLIFRDYWGSLPPTTFT